MEFKDLQAGVHDMYMILNDQSVNNDFITTLKWEHLEEFLDEIHMIKNMTVMKVQANSKSEYNETLIGYLRKMGKRSAREYFNFVEKRLITDEDYSRDETLTDSIFDLMADGIKVDTKESVIYLFDNLELTDSIKELMTNYGFSLKVEK